jgi:hypothetical protein
MDSHLAVPTSHLASSDISAPSSRESSPSRPGRSGNAGNAPRSRSRADANRIKRIKQDLGAAIKACADGIKANKGAEEMDMLLLDKIDCDEEEYAVPVGLAAKLVNYKKAAIEIYDGAINKLLRISDKIDREGISLGKEQAQKLDQLPQYLLHREHAAASLVAFEAFHLMLEGESHKYDSAAAAVEKYSAAVNRLLELPRENWSLQLRSSKDIQEGSPWTLDAADVKDLDVKKLLDIALAYEAPSRENLERKVEVDLANFQHLSSRLFDALEEKLPDDDVSEAAAVGYVEFVKEVVESFADDSLQQAREGIAVLKQSIARLGVTRKVSGDEAVVDEVSNDKRRYESEALTIASTVLRVQHLHLLHAQLSFVLSPESEAVLNQVQDKLEDLVMKHPGMLNEGMLYVDVNKLSQEEKEQMYGDLSILPGLDNEAARHLRYLVETLSGESVTEDNKDHPLLIDRLSGMAGDLEEAAELVEVMLGELILAGVGPQNKAASEGAAEEWHLQLAYSDDEGPDVRTQAGDASPGRSEPASKRSSLIRSRANSLIDSRRFSLMSLERLSLNEIDKAKAYSRPFEVNMALMAQQAASNEQEADKVLANLRKGVISVKNPANIIYELLNLAADRHSDRLKDLNKIIARWKRIESPTDEVSDRIAGLVSQAKACEAEIRTLKGRALTQAVLGIEQSPSAEGVLFLHKHGLIEGIDRPVWLMFLRQEYDHAAGRSVQKFTQDGQSMVDYIHEWPIRAKYGPDSNQTFTIYAHDHKKQDIEHPHPETLTESAVVTWKSLYYHDKGAFWSQRMVAQGWSMLAATVQRRFSTRQILDTLVRHHIPEEANRVPVEKRPKRLGDASRPAASR